MKSTLRSCFVAVVALVVCRQSSAQELSRPQIYYRTIHATAWVFGPNLNGTGWVVDRERRLVLTNRHIAENAEKASAIFPIYENGRVISDKSAYKKENKIGGAVIHREPKRDLALIQLDRLPDDVTHLKLADKSAPAGVDIHVIGNEGLAGCVWTYTPGKVSRVWHMRQSVGGIPIDSAVVTIQAAFTAGDSGGPVVNDKGEIVAIISATGYSGGGRQFSGFCIDVTEIKAFVADGIKRLKEDDAKPAGEENREAKAFALPKFLAAPKISAAERSRQTLKATAWLKAGNNAAAGFLVDAEKKWVVTSAAIDGDAVAILLPQFKDDKLDRDRAAYEGKAIRGKVVQRDPATDLAVVELESLPDGLAALPLAAAGPLAGEELHLVTSPKGKLWQERSALVRNGYLRKTSKAEIEARVVLLNHTFSDGESGGPVVNVAGEVVGVTSNRATNMPMLACCIDVAEVRAILAKVHKK